MNQNAFQTLINEARQLQAAGQFGPAIEKATQAAQADPGHPEPVFLLGQLYRSARNPGESVRLFKILAQHFPDKAELIAELSMSLWDAGEHEEAYETAKKAVDLNEKSPVGLEALGRMAALLERWPIAVESFRRLNALVPNNPEFLRQWYTGHYTMYQFDEAAEVFEKILELEGETPENLSDMARIYFTARRFEKAEEYYQKALEKRPDEVEWLLYLARCKIQFGDVEAGEALARKAIEIKPDSIHAYTVLHELKPKEDTSEAIKMMEKTIDENAFEKPMEKAYTHVFLGKYYHKEKKPNEAFQHFKAYNDIRHDVYAEKGIVYDPKLMEANYAETKKVFSKQGLEKLKGCGSKSEVPIFIVAMPRSGTTLLEQIIASHSLVYGAGELTTMGRLFFDLNYKINEDLKRDIHEIIRENAKEWADIYLDSMGAPEGVLRATDKMPVNFIHLGLIEAMFPNARVIHIKRHPLDCCLSIYSNNFSESYAYSAKLEHLGHYYNLYADLMKHWKKTLNMKFFELQYEDLVEDPEGKSREILEFCGLDWEDKVLEFYKGKKAAFTISQIQVSQPINKRGMARWKPYEKLIQPLIGALDEDIVGPLKD